VSLVFFVPVLPVVPFASLAFVGAPELWGSRFTAPLRSVPSTGLGFPCTP